MPMEKNMLSLVGFRKEKAVAAATACVITPAFVAAPTTTSAQEIPEAEPEPKKETESEAKDNLDDLEKHLVKRP